MYGLFDDVVLAPVALSATIVFGVGVLKLCGVRLSTDSLRRNRMIDEVAERGVGSHGAGSRVMTR